MMDKKIVYIVDDDAEVRNFLKTVLSDKEYKIYTYSNGIKFFESLKERIPDIILLDVMMSWMAGLNICSTLKNNPKHKNIPIIIITAYKDNQMQEKIKKRQPDACLYKPFNIDELFETIERLI
jgi:CheY-like chemotaxis protein